MEITAGLVEKFHAGYVIDVETLCWVWIKAKTTAGYGEIHKPGTKSGIIYVHKLSYVIYKRAVPKGKWVLHHCDNRSCANPEHLYAGTRRDNIDDMVRRGRSPNGLYVPKKLTEADVLEIYKLHDQGLSAYLLDEMFGMSRGSCWLIVTGRRWKHLYHKRHQK